jgi:2-succinyl-5-enolpyruvyl-6-hydroxy-3-cyclohexene-1-carboxylate synthase
VAPLLTVVLVDNKRGGFFSFPPVAGAVGQEAFERLWGTPQNVDLKGKICGTWFVTSCHERVPFCLVSSSSGWRCWSGGV